MDFKAANKSGVVSGTLAATTIGVTPSYVEVLRIDTRGCGVQGKALVNLINASVGTSFYFKIDCYPHDSDGTLSGTAINLQPECRVASNTASPNWTIVLGAAAIVVSARNYTYGSGTATSYKVEYTTF